MVLQSVAVQLQSDAIIYGKGNSVYSWHGLPEFKEDLREIDPKFNNVLVFDDLSRCWFTHALPITGKIHCFLLESKVL